MKNILMIKSYTTDQEITDAFFFFKPFKSPDPNDLHHFSYQFFWNIMGNYVKPVRHQIFDTSKIPSSLNQSSLWLIP